MKKLQDLDRSLSKEEQKKIKGGSDCSTNQTLYYCTVKYAGGSSMQGYSCGGGSANSMALELAVRDATVYGLNVTSSSCYAPKIA